MVVESHAQEAQSISGLESTSERMAAGMLDRQQLLSDERLADLGGDQPGGSGDLLSTSRTNQATLTVQGGARDGMTLLLTVTPFTLGREPSNDVKALDATVSRHHVVIWRRSGRWMCLSSLRSPQSHS